MNDALAIRNELQDQHQQQVQAADLAEERCRAAEAEIQERRANIVKLKMEAAALMQQNRELKHQMLSGTSWASPSLLQMYSELVVPAE